MNTTQLECFLAVADFLNYSRAAEHLHITQPAVSHQINALEDELETTLFYRTSKRVRLTQEGHLFSQYAREILALSRMSKDRLRESRQSSVVRFGIGCRSSFELDLLKPALRRLRKQFPLLLPVLRLVPSASLDNLLEDGDIQAMFTFQETVPKRAVYRELMQRNVVCICGEDDPFADWDSLTVQQLRSGDCFAVYPPHSAPPALLSLQGQILTGRSPDQICFCDSPESVLTLVEAGYAYALAAEAPDLKRPGLKAIPVAEVSPLSYGISYRTGESHPMLHDFLRQVEATFQRQ